MMPDIDGFQEIEIFPKHPDHAGFVYVFSVCIQEKQCPFYVGETTRFHGRMDDYFWATFQAPTDFKVGMAIRYFCDKKNGRVFARYRESSDRHNEERKLIEDLRKTNLLLNDLPSYKYSEAETEEHSTRVHDMCDAILAKLQNDTAALRED